MKRISFLFAALVLFCLAACKKTPEDSGLPYLKINDQTEVLLPFEAVQSESAITVKSNREWHFEALPDDVKQWLDITPAGKQAACPNGATVTVTVMKNTGVDRKCAVTFTNGTKTAALTVKQKGEEGPGGEIFEESFESSLGEFTINNVSLPSQLKSVWSHDATHKCAKASAYYNKVNYASESWLISPVIDMAGETVAYLSFEHAGNQYNEKGKANTVWVRESSAETWTQLTVPQDHLYDAAYTFKNSGDIDLKDYLGKKIQIGFKYTSTSSKAGTWELQNVKIARTAQPVIGPTICNNIAEVKAAGVGANILLQNILVVQANATGGLLGDGKDYLYVYTGEAPAFKVGDKINISGSVVEYPSGSSRLQISPKQIETVSSDNPVNYPEAVDITSGFDTYAPAGIEYVKLTGTVTISGTYANVNVEGATAKTGSIVSPAEDLSAFNNMLCEIVGFYVYSTGSGGKYTNIAHTSIKPAGGYLSAAPTRISVKAGATTASFAIKSDQSWSISSEWADLTIEPSSGTGDATVNLTFPENTTYSSITNTLNIACTSSETIAPVTVTVILAGAPDPDVKMVELTNEEICSAISLATTAGANGYTNITFNSLSGSWTGLVNAQANSDKTLKTPFVQIRDKNASCLQSPKFGSAIIKMEITVAAGKNDGQKRTLYAIPVATALPESSTYPASLYATNYGSVETIGGAEAATFTMVFTQEVDECKLVTKGGANYIDSIKIYLK